MTRDFELHGFIGNGLLNNWNELVNNWNELVHYHHKIDVALRNM